MQLYALRASASVYRPRRTRTSVGADLQPLGTPCRDGLLTLFVSMIGGFLCDCLLLSFVRYKRTLVRAEGAALWSGYTPTVLNAFSSHWQSRDRLS
jgi:hypothetical protein